MNNLDKAAMLIDEWTKEGAELNSAVGDIYAIPRMLAADGLLAPEPPEIIGTNSDFNSPIFDGGYYDVEARNQKEIRVSVDYSTELCLNAYQARRLAAALLAAANHAEQEQA